MHMILYAFPVGHTTLILLIVTNGKLSRVFGTVELYWMRTVFFEVSVTISYVFLVYSICLFYTCSVVSRSCSIYRV